MKKYEWIITALTGLVQLWMNTANNLEARGEMTPEEAQAERDRVKNIWQQEYAKTDAERGRTTPS
jgi:hypothetical protein